MYLFNKKNGRVMFAADEAFLRHYEQGVNGGKVLVPKGTNIVPPTKDTKVKEGRMLMTTIEITSYQLLISQIIFQACICILITFIF